MAKFTIFKRRFWKDKGYITVNRHIYRRFTNDENVVKAEKSAEKFKSIEFKLQKIKDPQKGCVND